ncbi:hypothetical protein CS542_09170 [Pedobacter sp. IW39]|nr:hypothetical protein CS542_09170 [Pedobacter sp. IW39]
MSHLEELGGHCASQMHVSSPADYSLRSVTGEELDNFLEEDFNGTPRRMQLESMYRLSGLQEGCYSIVSMTAGKCLCRAIYGN